MRANLGFFEGLSMGLNSFNSAVKPQKFQCLNTETKTILIKLLNQYHNLFENLDNLSQDAGLKVPFDEKKLTEEYSRLYAQFHQEIQRQQSLFSTQEKLAERYETLFKRYDQKLKNKHLTNRQRIRYQKLWIQYGMLYAQYGNNPSSSHGNEA